MEATSLPTLLPALITPFSRSNRIDEAAHRQNIALLTDRSVSGFLIGGSTGHGPYLARGERHVLVAAARDVSGPDITLICGVAAESTSLAIDQAREAADAGADAVLVMTPTTLVRGRDELVVRHFWAIADASTVPVLLYTVPSVTAYELPVAAALSAARHDNVIGMKDSGGDPSRLAQLADLTASGFAIFAGSSPVLAESGRLGAHGAITASANYAPALVAAALDDRPGAQASLTTLTGAIEPHGIAGTQCAAGIAGLAPGIPRPPVEQVENQALSIVRAALAAAGIGGEASDP